MTESKLQRLTLDERWQRLDILIQEMESMRARLDLLQASLKRVTESLDSIEERLKNG